MKKPRNEFIEPNYNEKKKPLQKPAYPKQDKIDFKKEAGAYVRMKLESIVESGRGIQIDNLKDFDIDAKDIVKYRPEIINTIHSIISEGKINERLFNTAITFSSALKFSEFSEIIEGIASDTKEESYTRGLAIESLGRLNNKVSLRCIRNRINDPNPILRKKAVEALGVIGKKSDVKLLISLQKEEKNYEINSQIIHSIKKLDATVDLKLPRRRNEKIKLIEEESNLRQIGKSNIAKPQTTRQSKNESSYGGRDFIGEKLATTSIVKDNSQIAYEYVRERNNKTFIRIISNNINSIESDKVVQLHSINEFEKVAEIPNDLLKLGKSIPLQFKDAQNSPKWLLNPSPSPVIFSIDTIGNRIWKDEKFDLVIKFWGAEKQRIPFLKILIKMPNSNWQELFFEVNEKEQQLGEKRINGFLSKETGEVQIIASVYSNSGGKSDFYKTLLILPPNPLTVNIVPQTRGTNGQGPAHYNSSENRFYCYAKCTFVNGYPHSVTVNRKVTCKVTDGGKHVATFDFDIGSFNIPANSQKTINIYTSHGRGGGVYEVFKNYGDVTMDFTFNTSERKVSDWNAWAAMAQVKLALIFVGNMSTADRISIQSIAENEASSILEQHGLYISETKRFHIPSDHSDWDKYRDLKMNENKDGDCAGSKEADDLRNGWSAPAIWLDVFIVESFSGPACAANILGFSPINGPTSKSGKKSGFVIRRNGRDIDSDNGRSLMGGTIAHELGHFLGLEHNNNDNNFMFFRSGLFRTEVTYSQFLKMAKHGFVKKFIPSVLA